MGVEVGENTPPPPPSFFFFLYPQSLSPPGTTRAGSCRQASCEEEAGERGEERRVCCEKSMLAKTDAKRALLVPINNSLGHQRLRLHFPRQLPHMAQDFLRGEGVRGGCVRAARVVAERGRTQWCADAYLLPPAPSACAWTSQSPGPAHRSYACPCWLEGGAEGRRAAFFRAETRANDSMRERPLSLSTPPTPSNPSRAKKKRLRRPPGNRHLFKLRCGPGSPDDNLRAPGGRTHTGQR